MDIADKSQFDKIKKAIDTLLGMETKIEYRTSKRVNLLITSPTGITITTIFFFYDDIWLFGGLAYDIILSQSKIQETIENARK